MHKKSFKNDAEKIEATFLYKSKQYFNEVICSTN